MFQRLDRMRKHSFGSVILFGTDNKSTISGVWFWRGHDLAFEVNPLQRDMYIFREVSILAKNTAKVAEF